MVHIPDHPLLFVLVASMEQILFSPSGVIVRLGARMQLAMAAAPLLSVHFCRITMAPRPPAAAGGDDDASFSFSPPFFTVLHESTWEHQARRMIHRVAGDLLPPPDLRFLVRVFCDYTHVALQGFLMQGGGGGGGGILSLSVLLQFPNAAGVGPYRPPRRPRIPDIVVGPYDHLVRAYLPENSTIQLDGGVLVLWPEEEEDDAAAAAVDIGNKPASASAVRMLKRVVFGEEGSGGGCRETSCAVCIDDFEARSMLSVMPCGHGFHSACLGEWLERSNLCPLCRFSLPAAN